MEMNGTNPQTQEIKMKCTIFCCVPTEGPPACVLKKLFIIDLIFNIICLALFIFITNIFYKLYGSYVIWIILKLASIAWISINLYNFNDFTNKGCSIIEELQCWRGTRYFLIITAIIYNVLGELMSLRWYRRNKIPHNSNEVDWNKLRAFIQGRIICIPFFIIIESFQLSLSCAYLRACVELDKVNKKNQSNDVIAQAQPGQQVIVVQPYPNQDVNGQVDLDQPLEIQQMNIHTGNTIPQNGFNPQHAYAIPQQGYAVPQQGYAAPQPFPQQGDDVSQVNSQKQESNPVEYAKGND